MAIVKEVLDAINAVSKGIENMQRISKAIKTGKDYLKTQHPDVSIDLVIMCDEMRKSSNARASVSSIVTNFRFVVGDAQADSALVLPGGVSLECKHFLAAPRFMPREGYAYL